jgi:YD repeat-containing protein
MATAVLIDLTNYDSLLKQSTQGRAGSPDGNVYFDKATGKIEFITKQELAQINLGSGLEDNPLDETLGIKMEAVYAFENQERAVDEDLRKYDRWTRGTFKFGGAYQFVNSRKPSIVADRSIIRGSGWIEYASDGGIDRIYFGNKGLANIEGTSQPYYQLSDGGAPVDFAKLGQIDEAVQVYGDTGNTPSDAGAGDFDSRTYEAVVIRTFGNNYDKKETTTDLGINELGPYSTGFALTESAHLTTGNYALADVFGGAQISPWTGMGLEELDTPVVIGGFNEADGTFTWVVNNSVPGTLDEVVAFLDALAQTDDDINDHSTNVTNGKRVNTWYTYDAQGRIVTRSGADGNGLYIYNVPVADQQRIVFTDDGGNSKTYPFFVSVEAEIGANAKADANAWYHGFFAADYNTDSAVTIEDSSSSEVKGLASAADGDNKIIFSFDYDGDTLGGGAGTPKNCVFLCEGDGGVTQAKTLFTITRITTVAFACIPGVETNV